MSDIVLYETRGRIGLITLNRPEARNAVNGDVAAGVEAAIDQLEADDEVWVGILTANTEGQDRPGVQRRRRSQGDQLRAGRQRSTPSAAASAASSTASAQAGDRRRRRPGHGRRMRDRPRRRPRRRHHPLVVRPRRGQAQPDRRRRRPVPPAAGDRPGSGDGSDPHRRADPAAAGLRPRPRQPPRRAGPGRRRGDRAWPSRSAPPLPSPCGPAARSCWLPTTRTTRR